MSKKYPELLLALLILAASPAYGTSVPKPVDVKELIESSKVAEKTPVKKASPAEIREWVNSGKAFFNGGFMGTRDYGKAYELFSRAAAQEDAEGLYMLGTMTYEGKGTRPNERKAFELYERAAEKGHTDSQMLTGTQHMYLAMRQPPESQKRKEEYALAAKWFKLAADKKQPEAMLWYGDMQLRGLGGIPQDKKAGVERVRQSAELHNANAMAVLGGYYMDGDVLPRNLREAYKYMMLSERSGNGNARLGLTMLEGKLPKGEQEAVREEVKEWLRKNPAPTRRPNN